MNKRKIGSIYEQKTKEYLMSRGHELLASNYQCKIGEVDLITKHEGTIHFIEVKYRGSKRYGHPSESVNYYKRQKIIQISKWFIQEAKLIDHHVAYDVAAWHKEKLNYYKGAFDVHG